MKRYTMLILFLVLSIKTSSVFGGIDTMPFPEIWHKGTVEQVFETAKKQEKFVFLYWGATWCPPCNSLKSAVFSQQKFKELAKHVVPYYLDGDYEMSQKWGEEFKISGYPTILLLNSDKKELMRISTAVNIEEFETAFMNSIRSEATILERVERLLIDKGTKSDWKIVARTYDWREVDNKDWDTEKVLRARVALYKKMPIKFKEEKLLMTGQLLSQLASTPKEELKQVKKISDDIGKNAYSMMASMVNTPENIYTIRGHMFWETSSLFTWASEYTSEKEISVLKNKWIAAAEVLYRNPAISVGEKFSTVYPKMGIYSFENPKAEDYSKSINEEINRLADEALTAIKGDYYKKHSLLPTLAYYLSKAGQYEKSKKILIDEMKTSDTPWYYQSGLAGIEERAKNSEQALYWSNQAKVSAKGKSTKLQWIRSDTYRLVKLAKKDRLKRINANLQEYYGLAFSLNDGFSGRNGKGFLTLLEKVTDEKEKTKIATEFKKYQKKCSTLKSTQEVKCEKYFSNILKIKLG